MKRKVISVLAAIMLLVVCIAPAWADTDKEIQFAGHTFGETFPEAAQKNWISTVEFQRKPKTTRCVADPVFSSACWVLYDDSQISYCFFSRTDGGQKVAGHDAEVVLRFYFPTAEAAAAFDLQSAILYGGEYEFWEDNKKAAFDDLKQKLTTVYGDPSAEFTNSEEFWGKPAHRENMSEEEANRIWQEYLQRYSDLSYAVWKQAGTDKQVVLVYSLERDGFEKLGLYYFDTSADAVIEQLYQQGAKGDEDINNDSLEGL